MACVMQVSGEKDFFAQMVVDAVSVLDEATLDLRMIGTKKVQGGGLRDSFLVDGVAFKKTFSYAGFEMQPKSYSNPKILLLNIELELKSEKENAEVSSSCDAIQHCPNAMLCPCCSWNQCSWHEMLSWLSASSLCLSVVTNFHCLLCFFRGAINAAWKSMHATGNIVQLFGNPIPRRKPSWS